ncbi:hypothetical protein WP3W18E02_19650 [Klebsiella sp. WP3-W18-ESBL-02]|uniref:hypothetical protein n=1 Tax=Klebsiella sp. WP3-W18-ESBL-02 TaxID=2675710 RepID=UPI0015DCC3AC|nr:hypothetical protein [Klebsiella sp. WP3-W18-ESBL-02]BBQ83436.1 hypothetical protein WP3W18E02_19650 [Klebsiella sp. WP3-W18-ESBL-02]
MDNASQYELIKKYFKDSVSFLASVLVLVGGSYYVSAIYFSEYMSMASSIIYLISAISFTLLTVMSIIYIVSDAKIICRRIRSKGLKAFVFLIIILNFVGCIGTILVAAANVKQAAQMVSLPPSLTQPVIAPLPPTQ